MNSDSHVDIVKVDRFLGNFEGWKDSFDYKTPERGVMTHVYAAFEPDLKGKICVRCPKLFMPRALG
jgi:hypothetical protein